jgi:decaprenylphospho-beta-D-ribofuranose 2-oxidase
MAIQRIQTELTNWSKTARSACLVYRVSDQSGIHTTLAEAQAQHLSVVPHGAGHSYTDAALNTKGVVIDLTPMRRILAWDTEQGVMRVEPGVTLLEMIALASRDGWWPAIAPSTPAVTIGGCAAMNVNGRNSWKYGPFGANILALDVLLASGEIRTLERERDVELFHAFVGSLGLLGFITSITIQMQRIPSGSVLVSRRSAADLAGIFSIFAEEEGHSDFMEAWLDGFSSGNKLGRGHVTYAQWVDSFDAAPVASPLPVPPARPDQPLVRLAAGLARPVLRPGVKMLNSFNYWGNRMSHTASGNPRGYYHYMFWPPAAFNWYHAVFLDGVETFQAFVPDDQAREVFSQVLGYSQQHGCLPIWCIIKKHRRDPFLLSYQVDGYSLELNYQRTRQNARILQQVLQDMLAIVIEAGGRFYLAKDHFLTHAQYRRSVGDAVVDTFLQYKQRFDPEMLLQSDLFRRLFQPALG